MELFIQRALNFHFKLYALSLELKHVILNMPVRHIHLVLYLFITYEHSTWSLHEEE
jgi:hypothetical protein